MKRKGKKKFPLMPDITININGVHKLLSNLKPDKAAGPDNTKPLVLKTLKDQISPILQLIFQKSLETGILPEIWTTANVIPLLKKCCSVIMNISFCGSGFLGIYHIGVAKALLKHAPSFLSKIERVGGASAGALIGALLVCSPSKLDACRDFNLTLAKDIRKKPLGALTPNFNLLEPVKEFIDTHLPEDGYKKANNVLFISLTKFKKVLPCNEVISTYSSNKTLVESLIASCYIPVYAGIKFPVIDGHRCTDGGLMNNLVTFEEGRTITVSPFSGNQDIAPTDEKGMGWLLRINNQTFQFNRSNGTRGLHAVFPPHPDVLLEYHDTGYLNAVNFLKKEGYFEILDT